MLCDHICDNVQTTQKTRKTVPFPKAQIGPEEEATEYSDCSGTFHKLDHRDTHPWVHNIFWCGKQINQRLFSLGMLASGFLWS